LSALSCPVSPSSISGADSARTILALLSETVLVPLRAMHLYYSVYRRKTEQMFSIVLSSGVVKSVLPRASKAPTLSPLNSNVVRAEIVPLSAVGSHTSRPHTSNGVFSRSHQLKVLRVNTPSVATQMVNVQMLRGNFPGCDHVGVAVRWHHLAVVVKSSVATIVEVANPFPAIVRLMDIQPKALFRCWQRNAHRTACALLRKVMHKAPVGGGESPSGTPPQGTSFKLCHTQSIPQR